MYASNAMIRVIPLYWAFVHELIKGHEVHDLS